MTDQTNNTVSTKVEQSPESNHEPRHEPDLIAVRPVVLSLMGLVVLITLSLLVVRATRTFDLSDGTKGATTKRGADQRVRKLDGPHPEVLADQPQQIEQLHAREDQQLHTYGWIDKKAGTARIPIERAMSLLVSQGLDSLHADDSSKASENSRNE